MDVSVIIPTYKGSDVIRRCVDTVINQTKKSIEIIVVDDNGIDSCEHDKTKNNLNDYIESQRITYVEQTKNSGGSCARNTGAALSNGDYLLFIDDDDYLSDDMIEKQFETLSNADDSYGLSYCSSAIILEDKIVRRINATKSGDLLYKYLCGKLYLGTGSVLLRKSVFNEVGGYDESFVRHQDWELYTRILDRYKIINSQNGIFYRCIKQRFLPTNLTVVEKNMDHYLQLLVAGDFHLPKKKIRRAINLKNSYIALRYLKVGDFRNCRRVLGKYSGFFLSRYYFFVECLSAFISKICGKVS